MFDVKKNVKTEEHELNLLREPKNVDYYEFSADPDLVVGSDYPKYDA